MTASKWDPCSCWRRPGACSLSLDLARPRCLVWQTVVVGFHLAFEAMTVPWVLTGHLTGGGPVEALCGQFACQQINIAGSFRRPGKEPAPLLFPKLSCPIFILIDLKMCVIQKKSLRGPERDSSITFDLWVPCRLTCLHSAP